MTSDQLQQTLRSLCTDVDEEIIRDFVSRMDAEYFDRFQPTDIAAHIKLAARLDPDRPCQVSMKESGDGLLEIVVVGYDYFSAFATICGLLSAFGLDIREGSIYTFADAAPSGGPVSPRRPVARHRLRGKPGLSRKKIVDVFQVRPLPGVPFTAPQQRLFVEELDGMVQLLDANRFQDARNRVNRRLVEALSRSRGAFTGLLNPVQIRFDNETSAGDTIMDIRSTDTPGFLYAFSNALAMRGIYISKARFENVGAELRDRFHIRGRHGHKIVDPAEQQELRLAAALIKQFTHFLTWAPDPAKAIDYFDRFLDRILEEARDGKALEFLKGKQTLTLLARLLGTSD
ncbi:MAG: hypothetical protein ACREIL_10285, partial [Nitrospiraceae bacterium]